MTIFEVLKATESRIRRTDAIALLSFVLERSNAELVRDYGEICSETAINRLETLLIRAEKGTPVAYISEKCEFYGLIFQITPDVLIPRPDSEPLIDAAIEFSKTLSAQEKITILDLCCGSGCLGLSAIANIPNATLTAVDISEKALEVTQRNANKFGLSSRVTLLRGDVLNPQNWVTPKADIVISNPPYVTASEMQTLDPSVRDYEPHLALYGGTDGLDFYRAIAADIARYIKPEGLLILECGVAQERAVAAITANIPNCKIVPTGTLES